MKTIPSYPSYCAGEDGRIYRDGRRLSQRSNGRGYMQVTLSQDGVVVTRYAHRLVCEAFYGPAPSGYECRHKNGIRSDNVPGNLQWSTKVENEGDKVVHDTLVWGDRSSQKVYTSEIVQEARRRASSGEQIKDIAAEWDVNERSLADAVVGRRWKRLPGAITPYSTKRKLKDDQVAAIRALKGMRSQLELAREFGVSPSAVGQIIRRETYQHVP